MAQHIGSILLETTMKKPFRKHKETVNKKKLKRKIIKMRIKI